MIANKTPMPMRAIIEIASRISNFLNLSIASFLHLKELGWFIRHLRDPGFQFLPDTAAQLAPCTGTV